MSITFREHLQGWTLAVSEATAGGSSLRGRSHGETLQDFACGENDTVRVRPDQGSGLG